jgi:hypothetical protein
VCQGTVASDPRIRVQSFTCLHEIAANYYGQLPPYMQVRRGRAAFAVGNAGPAARSRPAAATAEAASAAARARGTLTGIRARPPGRTPCRGRIPRPQEIFNLTVKAIKEDEEEVALQAIEFWSTLCDYELELEEEGEDAEEVGLGGGGAASIGAERLARPICMRGARLSRCARRWRRVR